MTAVVSCSHCSVGGPLTLPGPPLGELQGRGGVQAGWEPWQTPQSLCPTVQRATPQEGAWRVHQGLMTGSLGGRQLGLSQAHSCGAPHPHPRRNGAEGGSSESRRPLLISVHASSVPSTSAQDHKDTLSHRQREAGRRVPQGCRGHSGVYSAQALGGHSGGPFPRRREQDTEPEASWTSRGQQMGRLLGGRRGALAGGPRGGEQDAHPGAAVLSPICPPGIQALRLPSGTVLLTWGRGCPQHASSSVHPEMSGLGPPPGRAGLRGPVLGFGHGTDLGVGRACPPRLSTCWGPSCPC